MPSRKQTKKKEKKKRKKRKRCKGKQNALKGQSMVCFWNETAWPPSMDETGGM